MAIHLIYCSLIVIINVVWILVRKRYKRMLFHMWNDERNRADAAENKIAALAVQESHYPDLQRVNAEYVKVIDGMKARLKKSEVAPYGRYTARFESFPDLILFLMFDCDRNELEKEIKR